MSDQDPSASGRSDIVTINNPALEAAIAKALEERQATVPPEQRAERSARAMADDTFFLRRKFAENSKSDPNGYERIIGASDLLSINFLDRGRRAADAVCRIKLPVEGGESYGTGFLIGPRLLITNNHVLFSPAEAAQAEAEFHYEHDIDGVLRPGVRFNLDPVQLFYTSTELDITLVAVAAMSDSGVPIERYGWLPLLPLSGKSVDGEWVSIIQHPGGMTKQIAIHASQIIKLDPAKVSGITDSFIHYTTDTEPGSSGSPVLNDQWQVVAIHHKAVQAPRKRGDGGEIRWLANEGVRVSAIFKHLESKRFENENARAALDRLSRTMGFAPIKIQSVQDGVGATDIGETATEQFSPFKIDRWRSDGLGYDPNFLSTSLPLDPIYAKLKSDNILAPLLGGAGHELKYWHFSSIIHEQRRFPLMTAVNIDGNRLIHPGKRKDTWRQDARLDPKYQPDDEFYVRTRTQEKVFFSRGHLVRLLDPCWGDTQAESKRGMEDSFHFTNAAPQHQTYNDSDWGNLEDYILDKAQTSKKRLTVFTGPIFRDSDPLYGAKRKGGPWRIPLSFWKIAILQKSDDQIAAAAFIIGQTEYVRALYEARVFSGLKPYTIDELRSRKIQTTIAAVEEATGLDFSALRTVDAHGSLESTLQTRWFDRLDDVLI